jgi:hypothetical protein
LEQHHLQIEAAGLTCVAVGLGQPRHARRYCPALAPSTACVVGRGAEAHMAYGLARGRWHALAGGAVIAAGLRATGRGFRQGPPTGDTRLLPGTFVVDTAGRIAYAHYGAHAADHPDLETLLDAQHRARPQPTPVNGRG